MPLIDMPLEQLKAYQGRSPRPADFDTFWDTRLAEMRALDPKVEIVPSGFDVPFAKCSDMYFTGVGGARVHAKLWQPADAPKPHPAVLVFHGYGRALRGLVGQTFLRRVGVYRRGVGLSRAGWLQRGCRRGGRPDPERAHCPRPGRPAGENALFPDFSRYRPVGADRDGHARCG